MSGTIDRLRSWLERNKIFFDITTTLLLALMTVTVSISANAIAKNQNDLMKEEGQPFFRFKLIEDYKNKDNSSNKSEALEIYNDGKPAYGFSARQYAILEISNLSNGNYYNPDYVGYKHAYVPINTYFDTAKDTNSPTGLLTTLRRSNLLDAAVDVNGSNRSTVENSSISAIISNTDEDFDIYLDKQSNHREAGSVSLYTYVYITYSDIYGEKHDEIYWISDYGIGKLCENDKITLKTIYFDYLDPYSAIYYLTYIPPTEIIEYLSKSSYEGPIPPGNAWHTIAGEPFGFESY